MASSRDVKNRVGPGEATHHPPLLAGAMYVTFGGKWQRFHSAIWRICSPERDPLADS